MMDAPPEPPSPTFSPYEPWRTRDFRRYAACWFLLVFSKQVEMVAVGVYLYAETDDVLALGWAGLVQALPVMLLAIAGGQLADRLDRRHLLLSMVGLSALAAGGMWHSALLGQSPQWLYLFLGTAAVAAALGGPARAALLPQIVPLANFAQAVTWNTTIFHVAAMTGPAVGGIIFAATGPAMTFAIVFFLRVLAGLALWGVRPRPQSTSDEPLSLASLLAGIQFVWRTKPILATITLDLFAVLLGGMTYLLPVFVKDILGKPEAYVGFLRSMEAVGAITMAMILAHSPLLQRPGQTILWAVAGFGVATIIFGLSQWVWLSLTMMFFIGALDNISVVIRHTLVQTLTPDAMRGRVSAVHNVFITASNDLGGFESGVTAKLFGPVISVVGGGIGTILVVIATALKWPQLRTLGPLKDARPGDVPEVRS